MIGYKDDSIYWSNDSNIFSSDWFSSNMTYVTSAKWNESKHSELK